MNDNKRNLSYRDALKMIKGYSNYGPKPTFMIPNDRYINEKTTAEENKSLRLMALKDTEKVFLDAQDNNPEKQSQEVLNDLVIDNSQLNYVSDREVSISKEFEKIFKKYLP